MSLSILPYQNRYLRPILLLLLLSTLLYTVPSLYAPTTSRTTLSEDVCGIEDPSSCSDEPILPIAKNLQELNINLGDVVSIIQRSIEASGRGYDSEWYKNELGFKVRYESLEGYRSSLSRIWEMYFHVEDKHGLEGIMKYLSFLPPSSPDEKQGIPKNVYTTSLEDPNKLPEQFNSWTKENGDYAVRFVEDDEIDGWIEGMYPSSGLGREMGWLKERSKWGVVRSDLFRYLVLLLNGGIYTDTDTACVLPVSQWGKNADHHRSTNPLLEALPQLLSLSSSHPDIPDTDDSPSLIIALENDSPSSGSDWRAETFVRGIQVVQWTIASRKGHPVFLDVVGHALDKVRELREVEERGWEVGDEQDILEWSGPGAFTDAVFRYLLIRYGFHPKQASGLDKPLRVGDVLIMPVHSFRADASEGYQGDEKAVWHGFFGRWKPT
ncbi:hypothetical protein I302_106794 [Kwoniella bestiolae CBS 10118]|uniref:Alpha-1,6-mannosyltransferase n=1 Tax=Kwoniella bestiolae CBS 10118 TaxID=1296100 RepID=A0A1B9G0D7_9TREE|nr:hypothetical protein I302_05940 [Kwoniella bestiolae CBS 10118]OCF24480.1 hypothetical protein I302_05940 [Kwoniella bestiolae CBS 10118]